MIEPAVVLVDETASVVVVLLAAKAGTQDRRMMPHSNIAKNAGNRNRLAIVEYPVLVRRISSTWI
jgi:hypothetical protein